MINEGKQMKSELEEAEKEAKEFMEANEQDLFYLGNVVYGNGDAIDLETKLIAYKNIKEHFEKRGYLRALDEVTISLDWLKYSSQITSPIHEQISKIITKLKEGA